MKQETKYNKVVNFDEETKEIIVLGYTFNNGSGFKGATGSTFEPVSLEQYNEETNEENLVDRLVDSGIDLPEQFKRGGFEALASQMIANDEVKDFMFDYSYSELWDYLREQTGLSENEAYIFNCIGGGRCFDKDFQGNVNVELSEIIRQAEAD